MGTDSIRIPRRYRRAILIYLITIVVPVGVLLWMGVESFERQREALATLTAEKLAAAIDVRKRQAAQAALDDPSQPIATHFFTIQAGELTSPVLRTPLPPPLPPTFIDADRLELRSLDETMAVYRRLSLDPAHTALALSRIARAQSRAGRKDDATRTWRELAAHFPDALDPFGRPYGIVAAIQAGDTRGLLDKMKARRWDLPADQAEYFANELGAAPADPYLDRFRFAREIAHGFRPILGLREGAVHSTEVAGRPIFYRAERPDVVRGFAADRTVLNRLEAQVQGELGLTDPQGRDLRLHAAAVGVVSLLLTAGVVLLLRETSREARTNELRAEFVSGVSHELKTPITLVRLYGETLLRHETLPDSERRHFYRIITRESARLGRLVDQVLAFSRIERGQFSYELQDGDLAAIVHSVLDDYHDWVDHAGFSVVRDVPESSPPLRLDPAAVAQALVNLLDNALKYSGDSRALAVRLLSADASITIEVEDHGPGIPPEEQARIFDRFYRASRRSGKGGYGLGLFMVRHIMRAHGGEVKLESEKGRGSCFRLVFPRQPA